MGRISAGATCSVEGCGKPAVRSISAVKAAAAGLKISASGRRVYLCRDHYKEYKKRTRRERELETARWKI